jgi:hypothetical protein
MGAGREMCCCGGSAFQFCILERFACLQFIVNFVLLLLLNTICAVLESKPVCLYLFVCYSVGSPLHMGAYSYLTLATR